MIIPKDANAVFGGNATQVSICMTRALLMPQSLSKSAHILLAAYMLIREEYPLLEGKNINEGGKYKVFPVSDD